MLSAGCYHSVAVTANGMLYMFGRNNHGQLGTGDLEERHAPHPVDDFIGQHIVSVAAGFYHTIVLTSDNADNNSATLMGFQVVGSTIVKSIPDPAVEYESVSSNLFPGWNSEASMSVLLKDSKLLANVTTDDAVSPTTKARAEAGNKAMIYELLRFMMNHIEDFSLVKSGTISFALRSYTKTNRLLELDQSLSSIVMLIKFCADSVTSSQSIIEISTFEALTCILKLIRIVAVLISKEKTLIEVTLRRNSKIDELSSSWQNLLTKPMTRDKVELVELRQAFEQLSARASSDRIANEMDSDAKVALEDGSSDLSVLLKLRQLLLQLYFHLKVEEDTRWLLLEICAEIANCLSTSHTVFFPRASLESKFVAMLKENGIVKNEDRELSPQASLQEMKLSFELSNLRLLTAYCSIYRTGDEVITLFQKSKMDGLIVFRQLVSAYSYFSKQVMDHRISGSSHFRQNDIRKSINVLEHSITAFIKSAIPLILTASCSPTTEIILITSGLDIGSILGDEKLEIQRYGAEIFCDVLIDAENILDSLLSQALNEDILGQLRYGTIMPSILPSIILYAISFSKYGCVILEVLPQLQHIIKKLQLLGKCELKLPSKVTAPSPNTSTGGSQAGSEDGESAQANEDILMNRKDSPNVSWWYRLMKLMIHYYGKICSCLVTVPFKALYQQDMRNDLTDSRSTYRSEVWWFVHPNCDLIHENLLSITTILNAAIEENQNYDEVRKITIRYREQEKEVDPMYRMLSSSSHLSFSGQIFNAMEEVMMKAIISVIGIPIAEVLLRDSFKMITRFVKSIQSKKSSIIACMEQTSWIEILTLMYNIIKFFCDVFVQGSCRISNQPLDIPILQKYKYRAQWRKVLLITTVLKRWKKARVLKAKNISNIIVEYIGRMVSTMTQNYTIFTVEEVAQRLEFVATSYINADSSILKFNLGVQTCLSLLEDVSSVSFQNDLIQSMLLSIKLCNSSNPSHDEVRIRNTICVSKHTNHELKSSTMAIILYITRTMEKISSAASIPSGDITKVGQLMKLLYLLSDSELGLLDPSEILLRIPFQLMKKIVTALNSNYTSVSTNPAEEKSGKKTINQRDKSQIYRKATSAIITTIEALVFSITDSNRQTYVGSMIPLLNVVNDLLNDYEKISSETTNSEENESQDSSSKNKDANAKKRCQDLITKPIEFCKASEGYVLPGEKLMNNYKSIDFTVATWIFITKKNCDNKYNFIAGKVNHNDAWPIIVVRNDGKLEVCYGHNNELEKITSEGSIPFYVWTHIGFVIEQKKIKIFINGALDIQSNTTKGNSRAVLYPLVIGSCPISIRSRVNHIRDGFDGMLAQFKYYSRALSPIHIKFICDGGPPESGDFYEQWIYKLITCVKCIVEATTWNEETEACTATACLLHKLYVRNRSQRIKFASLDILCSMLKRNNLLLPNLELTATKSINTISNSSCEGEVPDPSCDLNKSRSGDSKRRSGNVRLEEAPFLQDADSLEKKMILYFIRTLGLCWHQPKASDDSKNELLSQLYKHLATDDVSKAAAESMDEINLEKKYNYIMLKEFTGYIPSLAIVDNVNSNLSSLLQGSGTNSSVSEKMLDNQVVREELSFHIVKCLRNLARASPIWSSAISSVVSEVFEKYQLFLERIEEPSSLLLTDIIGCTILLGGDKYSYHIGMDVLTNYNSNLGRVIYLNRSTNSAIVLTVSSSLMVKQILKVRLHDLVVKDDYCLLHLSEGIVASAVKILNSMDKYVGIVLNDLLLSDHPDHPFQNKIVLTCSRPLELFIFSKLLRSLTRVNKYSINLSEHRNLFEVLQQAAVSITNMSSDSESVVENNSAGEARFLQWTSCARYIQSLPSKLVQLPLLTTERSRTIFDYVSKHLGIALESLQSTPYEKLLLGGRLSELVQSLAIGASKIRNRENLDSESDFSTYEQVVMSDWSSNSMALLSNFYSPNEEEIKRVLQLLISFRTSIISSSRTILSIARNAEKTELVSQTTPWNIILWQSILPKLTSQRTAFSIIQKDYVFQLNFTWTLISQQFFDTNKLEVTQSLASALRYSALSLLQLHAIKAPGNLLESTDIFKKALQTMVYWLEYNNDRPNPELLFYQMLRILLPSLSFIECSKVELQLMQLCLFAINKICLKIFDGYIPTKDLLDLAKSNNFTLLRARAQEQIIKYKGHNLGSVSPLAYNLTQLVAGLEIIQRHAVNNSSPVLQRQTSGSTKSSKITNTLQIAKIQSIETAAPKIVGVRSTSVDADLADCALTAIQLLYLTAFQYNCDTNESSNPLGDQSLISQDGVLRPTGKSIAEKNIMIEVAISCGQTGNDMCFDTVYCGTSLRFVQSGLVPDCFYHMKCRAYVGALPLSWSPIINFKTDKGILFSFDTMKAGNDILLSDDGLTASYSGDDTWSTILASKSFSSGITSWEVRVNQSSTAYIFVGVASSPVDLNTFLGGCSKGYGFIGEQALYHNREKVKIYGETFGAGDVIGVTLDLYHGTLSFTKNKKSLGVAFDKIYGELFPAVAFYNVGQEIELLIDGFKTNCPCEPIPISPSRLNIDDISLLNELVLSMYHNFSLSHRLLVLVVEQCNQWCTSLYVRCRTVSGRDIFISKESPLLKRFGLVAGERVRTTYGVAEVAGSTFNKIWFKMNPAGEVWFFSIQQITDGRMKKLFTRCSYDVKDSTNSDSTNVISRNKSSENFLYATYDVSSVQDYLDPSKWNEEMDNILMNFLVKQCELKGLTTPFEISAETVYENFRELQQQLSKVVISSHSLTHRWGISGPKRKAVLARIGEIRLLNQMLEMYLPFLISDSASNSFLKDSAQTLDDYNPVIISLDRTFDTGTAPIISSQADKNISTLLPVVLSWRKTPRNTCPVGPLHTMRRRIFQHTKLNHFWEVVKKTTTRPAKTEDDYDYPEDLPHLHINRLKSFRAKEASELMNIPGEDLMMSSIFVQMWRELGLFSSERLRISYTHPMDDGQSRTFKIKFDGEGVDDYGGPYREIFQQMCDELQTADPSGSDGDDRRRPSTWASGQDINASNSRFADKDTIAPVKCLLPLLLPTKNWTAGECEEKYKYTFHPASTADFHLSLYRFLGQILGIAVRSKITLDLSLPSYIWKYVVGEPLLDTDLLSFDTTAYIFVKRASSLLARISSNAEEDIAQRPFLTECLSDLVSDLTWTVTRSDGLVVELIPGGATMTIDVVDVDKYLELYVATRLSESKPAIEKFREGLISIIPESSLSLLNWEELESVVCGSRTIDIKRLKENTEYDDDISAEDDHIINFWSVLEDFTEEEKSLFLKFVWARPTLPPKGVEFTQKMRVLSAVGDDAVSSPDNYLPKAHTCFFSINLPKYSSKEVTSHLA